MDGQLTPEEGIALDIIFASLGQSPLNREIDDWGMYYKYVYVAVNAPKLAAMHADVNKVLGQMAKQGLAPFEITHFRRDDRTVWYKRFPTAVSRETVRRAWVRSGMRDLQREYRSKFRKSGRSH